MPKKSKSIITINEKNVSEGNGKTQADEKKNQNTSQLQESPVGQNLDDSSTETNINESIKADNQLKLLNKTNEHDKSPKIEIDPSKAIHESIENGTKDAQKNKNDFNGKKPQPSNESPSDKTINHSQSSQLKENSSQQAKNNESDIQKNKKPCEQDPSGQNSGQLQNPLVQKALSGKERRKQKEMIRICIFIFTAIVFLILLAFRSTRTTNQPKKNPLDPEIQFNKIQKLLQKEFPKQNKKFLSTILSSYDESIISKGNPSIVMLVAEDDSTKSDCIAKRIFKVFGAKNVPQLDGNDLKSLSNDLAKLQIDEHLEQAFIDSENRYFLLKSIESIPSSSMIIFYTYGDDRETAKVSGNMIFFTYQLRSRLSEDQRKLFKNDLTKLTHFVENELTELWSDIHFDQLKPLFARIANNVVFLEREEQPCSRDEL